MGSGPYEPYEQTIGILWAKFSGENSWSPSNDASKSSDSFSFALQRHQSQKKSFPHPQILVKGLNKNKTSSVDDVDVDDDNNIGGGDADENVITKTSQYSPTHSMMTSQTLATEPLRDETNTPDLSDRGTNEVVEDSDFEDSESSHHRRLGLIRYRSLRDHNGRYYLVVKIR